MYWCQDHILSISKTTDQKGHKQATNTVIENPQLIFSDKLLKCTITDIIHGDQITTSVDNSRVTKGPVS
jgi:hypothetical protein